MPRRWVDDDEECGIGWRQQSDCGSALGGGLEKDLSLPKGSVVLQQILIREAIY